MYDHVVANQKVYIDGALAFDVGHRIPVETAVRLGIEGDVIKGNEANRETVFEDKAIHVSTTGEATVSTVTTDEGTVAPVTDETGTDTGSKRRG